MTAIRKAKKRYFTVDEANATLPLLRLIVRDITVLARTLTELHRQLDQFQKEAEPAPQADLDRVIAEMEEAQEQMRALERELKELNVELKDYLTGLVDFPARREGRDVYLCWRLGEPEVAHWHELDGGFSGRKRLTKLSKC
jgi:hypothetical protein